MEEEQRQDRSGPSKESVDFPGLTTEHPDSFRYGKGFVWAWGNNPFGELGSGSTERTDTAKPKGEAVPNRV